MEKKEMDRISSQPTCSKKSFAKLVARVVISVDQWYQKIPPEAQFFTKIMLSFLQTLKKPCLVPKIEENQNVKDFGLSGQL